MFVTLADVVAALRPLDGDPKQVALDHLGRLVALRADLERHITEAVAAAKQTGATWTEMGAQLGMQRQNAQRKYDPLLEETVKRTVTVLPLVAGKPCPDCGVKVQGVRAESTDTFSRGKVTSQTTWTAEPCGHARTRNI